MLSTADQIDQMKTDLHSHIDRRFDRLEQRMTTLEQVEQRMTALEQQNQAISERLAQIVTLLSNRAQACMLASQKACEDRADFELAESDISTALACCRVFYVVKVVKESSILSLALYERESLSHLSLRRPRDMKLRPETQINSLASSACYCNSGHLYNSIRTMWSRRPHPILYVLCLCFVFAQREQRRIVRVRRPRITGCHMPHLWRSPSQPLIVCALLTLLSLIVLLRIWPKIIQRLVELPQLSLMPYAARCCASE